MINVTEFELINCGNRRLKGEKIEKTWLDLEHRAQKQLNEADESHLLRWLRLAV
jgi:hypothetical protein